MAKPNDKASGQLKVIRIFICSSGDMNPERDAAEKVIREVQAYCRDRARLEVYRWEKNIPRFDTGKDWQANIPLPGDFDIFIGFVHVRIGTKLAPETYRTLLADAVRRESEDKGASDEPPTGTQFEIEQAFEASDRTRKPLVWLAWNKATLDEDHGLTPEQRTARDQQKADALAFCKGLENCHKPRIVVRYGEGELRSHQAKAGGLAEFERELDSWLRHTLTESFRLALGWRSDAYVGLRPFEEKEAPIFFGRRSQTEAVLAELERAVKEGRPPILLLCGPSGAGKSSFARAGLVAGLDNRYFHVRRQADGGSDLRPVGAWKKLVLRPSEFTKAPEGSVAAEPLSRLAEALGNKAQFDNESPVAGLAETIEQRLNRGEIPDASCFSSVAEAVRRSLARHHETAALFVVLDQMEELFESGLEARTRLLAPALLCALARECAGKVWVCLVLSDAWRSELDSAGFMPFLSESELLELGSPRAEELREIIEAPARLKGLRLEQDRVKGDLGAKIRKDLQALSLHQQAPLPLLEVALQKLEREARGSLLTFDAYEKMGGLSGAIQAHSAGVMGQIDQELLQAAFDKLFFKLLEPNPRREIVPRAAFKRELEADEQVWRLAQVLIAPGARLLVEENEGKATAVVRIAHEILREHFAGLKDFISRERQNLLLLADARADAERWRGGGKRATLLLLDRPTLDSLTKLTERAGIPGDDILCQFVHASRAWLLAADAKRALEDSSDASGALDLIRRGAALEFRDDSGRTLLVHAAAKGHADVVGLLLGRLPALAEAQDNNGATALHAAAAGGHAEVVRLLLERLPALAEARDNNGATALHVAAAMGHAEVVGLLLERLPALAEARANNGWTALDVAESTDQAEVAAILRSAVLRKPRFGPERR